MRPEKDPAMWSRRFAREVAQSLGISGESLSDPRVDTLLSELTEEFRYLPIARVNAIDRYASFLRASQEVGTDSATRVRSILGALVEVCELARFLRSRHGYSRPADEDDEWSDEDRRDFARAAWERLDSEAPGKEGADVQAR